MTANGKVGIGIIGFGGIANGAHAPGYKRLPDWCEIVAVADVRPSQLELAKSEKWGIPLGFEDYKKLLEMPEIDAVSVCTPNYLHMQPTIDALAAGKHVLCEKPMAMNPTECREMIAAEKQSGKILQIGYNMRFGAGAQALKRAIVAGEFEDIYYARARAIRRREVPVHGLFLNKELNGGGPLIDIGVHITDMTLWLAGSPTPVAVSGMTYNKMGTKPGGMVGMWGTWKPEDYTVEDFASAYIRFDNGMTMTLEASFIANIEREEFTTQIFGTGAGAYLDGYSHEVNIFREEFGTLTNTKPGWLQKTPSTHGDEIKAFLTAIRDKRTPFELGAATSEDGLKVAQIMEAIYRSAETGREATIS